MIVVPQLSRFSYVFPDPRRASPEGIVAFGGDLSPHRILTAYRNGIFPWYNEGDPILWWSPDPRCILYPDNIKISRSLKKSLKKYEVRVDTNFEAVIKNCKDIRDETWILPEIIEAFCELHEMGFAHSIETYYEGKLVGGLYGLSLGGVFFGESMFSKRSDASKVALVRLCDIAKRFDFDFIDCQIPSAHLRRMGAEEIAREQFLNELENALQKSGKYGKWEDICF
ncbi:leucyl/phenylalanyl-tRNA--protein transferase [Nitratiruptor sp. YY09-18]|uniref:leucyl/phenylalanyl-tRNA--protein transferase n=1 Tax=Nitratiruptor sp. YY09-18 TaxID=2724901 RepID=UPI001915EDE3|nr:leucyl/phenylalanyl-tRNA--protein transferase [Nitratiruptor sp. YY09-18]BCD67535.1 leucyl/phenylalanyl-tRNA---protein transferase [Nitratiruptor sp. YY09-18]